jgi:hypothetical protein
VNLCVLWSKLTLLCWKFALGNEVSHLLKHKGKFSKRGKKVWLEAEKNNKNVFDIQNGNLNHLLWYYLFSFVCLSFPNKVGCRALFERNTIKGEL